MAKHGDYPPIVSLVNRCKGFPDQEIYEIAEALIKQVNDDFNPAWGCAATIQATNSPAIDDWQIVFLDDADAGDNLGYHELTLNGQPISKVFVETTLQAGQKVSTTASHELLEMLIDPGAQMWAQDADGVMYAYEVCDAVEEVEYQIGGVWVSNFVYPSFFESWRAPKSTQFDREGKVSRPFETLRRGYQIVNSGGRVQEVFASHLKERHFREVEDRTFHRSEYRKARAQAAPQSSTASLLPGALRADALRYAGRHLMALADAGDPFPCDPWDWSCHQARSTQLAAMSARRTPPTGSADDGDPFRNRPYDW